MTKKPRRERDDRAWRRTGWRCAGGTVQGHVRAEACRTACRSRSRTPRDDGVPTRACECLNGMLLCVEPKTTCALALSADPNVRD